MNRATTAARAQPPHGLISAWNGVADRITRLINDSLI